MFYKPTLKGKRNKTPYVTALARTLTLTLITAVVKQTC
jgi:hypothetical protein